MPEIHRAAGQQKTRDRQQPHAVPAAPADPLAGIADWDAQRATVPCRGPASLGDLLVSADEQKTYVAVSCSTFVDPNAYPDGKPGAEEQHALQVSVGDARPCVVRFGIGKDSSVSDPDVKVRVHQRGLRYLIILAIPKKSMDADAGKHDPVQLTASLEDVRRGDRTLWSVPLAYERPVREAHSTPATLAQ